MMLNKCPTERILSYRIPIRYTHIYISCHTDNKASIFFGQRNGNAILLEGNGIKIKINIKIRCT